MTVLRDAARLLAQLAGATLTWWRYRGCEDCANAADENAAERCRDLCDATTCERPYKCWRQA